ncbi:CARDB domain-containing protein [Hymenobacter cheonanensis]|uniref:CARDB domain-containing protein n=1 Tax=Hymenobacter sp. CA2-7 TaxID=3063993 RepID=UPI00271426BB|nr:CARDB domain-containing protein [Hymenobacter sp. CA2-7]MDO7885264.1 CARDB domain-containing protein [Hymenobacter sp. CA2-7]
MKNFTFLPKVLLLLAGLLALHPARLRAQSYLLPATGTASYTTCAGTLYDDGGPNAPYDADAQGSLTLLPGTAGAKLKLEFALVELDSTRTYVQVYDGPDTNAPLICRASRSGLTVYATGSTGALTVVLSSYGGQPRRGLAATISCQTGAPPPPDLVMQGLLLSPARALAGDLLTSQSTVLNLAGGLTPYRLAYYLSTDNQLSTNDVPLEVDASTYNPTTSPVAAGNLAVDQRFLIIPASTTPGAYYVLCVAQANGRLPDANEANNIGAAPLTVLGRVPNVDLAITEVALYPPPFITEGTSIVFFSRLQNLGQVPASASRMGYYFSTDATLGPDDQLLGSVAAKLPANSTFEQLAGNVSVPPGTAPGTYYLLFAADYLDQVIEQDEQNNVLARKLVVGGPVTDLAFSAYRSLAPNQPAAGSTVQLSAELRNEGSAPLDSATTGIYLSDDPVLGPDDVLLAHRTLGPIQPSYLFVAPGYLNLTLPIPAGTALGKHYLLLVADYRHELAESNENNNVVALSFNVVVPDIDLAVSKARLASAYSPAVGTPLLIEYTLANLGTTTAYPATVGYYLSADNQLSPDDLLLSAKVAGALAGGGSQLLQDSPFAPLIVPPGTAPGAYYLLFVADYLHQVAETNEANNIFAVPMQLGRPVVDLTLPYNFDVTPGRLSAGTQAQVAYYFQNLGSTPAYTPAVGFYLSTDQALSADDVLIGNDQVSGGNALFPSYYNHYTSQVSVPRTMPPGQYYVLGVADYLNEFAETDETNNVRAAPLEITAPRPDLAVLANPLPYLGVRQVLAGGQVATENYVNNVGPGPAAASKVGYYLSADPVLSPSDVLLGSAPTAAVAAGASALVAGSFVVPAATPTGRYYVLFVADYLKQLDEVDLTNNLNYSTLSVSGTSLTTREQLAGYDLRVLPVPVASPAPLRVQLSGPGPQAEATLTLCNSLGQAVRTQSLSLLPGRSQQAELPTAGLAAGVYLLRLTGPGLNATRRVIIE